ncbi:MAG: SURF1 family protein [Pseudoxanthomonas sp.]
MSRSVGKLWLLALVVIALFCRAGVWQLDRAKQKQAMLAQSEKVLAERKPRALSAAADPARRTVYDWAAGEGRFAPAPAVLLDNQSHADRAGIRVYRVFLPDAAPPLLVELGWLPLPGDRTLPLIDTPAGPVHVAGLLAPPPSPGIAGSQAVAQADGNLLAIGLDRAELAAVLRLPTLAPRVLKLDPALKLGYTRDLDILPNTLPPERHLGYAVQWFGMALTVLITALVLTLRKRRPR